ncbi:MAG: hypothetical protein IJ637_02155 [Prevotella sp.]|nr:hypothetical protein [Prevotella sp.]
MRKTILCIALLAATAAQAMEDNDTTIITNAHKVMVVTGDSLQQIKVMGKEEDKAYVYENVIQIVDTNYVSETRTYRDLNSMGWGVGRKDKDGWRSNTLTLHFGLGISSPTNVPDGLSLRPFKSWEGMVWLQFDHTPKNKLQTYSVGLGVTARNYGIRDDMMFCKDANGMIGLAEFPPHSGSRSSTLSTGSISMPFFFTQKFGINSHYKLTVGPVVNFNFWGSLHNSYEIGDNEYNITTNHIGQRPVTIDFMGIFRAYGVGFYLKYSPMSVMKAGHGPQFRALSFGIYF